MKARKSHEEKKFHISKDTAKRILQRNNIVSRRIRDKPLLKHSHVRGRKLFYFANKDSRNFNGENLTLQIVVK